jgi:hypothetical protein
VGRSTPLDLDDPTAVLLAAVEAFRAGQVDVAVYGGLALAAYGEPRETKDADLAVAGAGVAEGERALRAAGLDVLPAFDRVPFGGNLVSRVTLLAGASATGLNMVDLVEPRSSRYARAALERAIEATVRSEKVRVLAPEDFVLFKVLSTRDRDLEDAASVVRALGASLDVAAIEREGETLAREITDHDVVGRLRRVL